MKRRIFKTARNLILLAAATILIAACQPKGSVGSLNPTPTLSGENQPPISAFTVSVASNDKLGNILVDSRGMTLYTFKNDSTGVSNCVGGCTELWQPLTVGSEVVPTGAEGVAGNLGVITREDGSLQVTYNGMPLYSYVGDAVPGDSNGQGIDGLWYAATP